MHTAASTHHYAQHTTYPLIDVTPRQLFNLFTYEMYLLYFVCVLLIIQVGVLLSHVHSIVMSSNGMSGQIPTSIRALTHLRMIELATMPGLSGPIPVQLCSLVSLRRLCICRCNLIGPIPSEIGQLVGKIGVAPIACAH
jgi:hypothetical protein